MWSVVFQVMIPARLGSIRTPQSTSSLLCEPHNACAHINDNTFITKPIHFVYESTKVFSFGSGQNHHKWLILGYIALRETTNVDDKEVRMWKEPIMIYFMTLQILKISFPLTSLVCHASQEAQQINTKFCTPHDLALRLCTDPTICWGSLYILEVCECKLFLITLTYEPNKIHLPANKPCRHKLFKIHMGKYLFLYLGTPSWNKTTKTHLNYH
jgi:hypothetical protein